MYTSALSLLALVGAAQAHMSMYYPAPLGGAPSINKQSTVVDKEFNYPLGCCGADGPTEPSPGLCRGHLDEFDTEEASVTWTAGQDAHFQLTDHSYDPNAPGSTHSGGSCQVGFSTDKGATWKVAASYHGACPKHTDDGSPEAQTFDFKVPTGMPNGDALFAWIWLNREHEAFMNCAKVKITGGSGNTTPTTPSQPSSPATTPKQSSGTTPQQPVSSTTPQQPDDEEETSPQLPDDEEDTPPPAKTSRAPRPTRTGRPGPRPTTTSSSLHAKPTPSSNDEDDSEGHWWSRPHKEVKADTRKYSVDGWSCACRREILNPRCYCDSSDSSAEKRAAIEKKALRMHRRNLSKRVDACDWASAPAMEVSYYTSDAKCAPNAKVNMPQSDSFELGWNVNCGVVEGDGEYNIKMMECGMYGA
ncbi:hypothetical protein FB567DRAFT_208956 [Paraphoma chrysanthemicola]|uniref:Lytic polysaccharide monooxygenase n=1 Tax=Paraphoma chrysanthemicola TaxID=798071 RepID=A0A8K0QUF2_9PLEO|nr:hypothetical protein FB567DRAFT_208956 [Paraphoma chrysanthemicola]